MKKNVMMTIAGLFSATMVVAACGNIANADMFDDYTQTDDDNIIAITDTTTTTTETTTTETTTSTSTSSTSTTSTTTTTSTSTTSTTTTTTTTETTTTETTTTEATTSNDDEDEDVDTYSDDEYDYDTSYIGNFRITGYISTGNCTASGTWPSSGRTIAMNSGKMSDLGLDYGDIIYIDGIGTFVLEDCGCAYETIDIFCDSESECYELTSYADAYLAN